ncbi:MAG: 1,4-dihydroxy-2-naphthoate polyprenyltransferase [Ignavibacteriaceae bacterium]|jgi:1,4-dihydroxy-2-naphthoate octaprenyltransferase|nr:1,4-dihydroxy-2-naphthoate polyprenyltransferase [Chlorobium sp.]MCW9095894.1 1,4-dihydroxy-2-naphthoate polyprenyltransferase [Ignavibacteriaceae bacterium]
MTKENKLNSWFLASRPKTLLAAVVPVLVGSALAISVGEFFLPYSLVALLCSILIQIGTNFTNDLYDFLKGADNIKRKGPRRVLASGLISVTEMKIAIVFIFGLAFLLGLYLVFSVGLLILWVGIISIIAGIAYTAGPFPLAYNGLGDLFVFIFFGIVGTMGTFYLHTQEISLLSFVASIPVGALITNILIVNNYRDIEEDREANKRTLAVLLGRDFTRWQYIVLIFVCYLISLVLNFQFNYSLWIFLPYLTLPITIILVRMLYKYTGEELNKTLELTARFAGLYGLLFSIGLII